MIGSLEFGITTAGAIGLTMLRKPEQIALALTTRGALVSVSLCAAGGWIAYLLTVQLIEPAVAFTIFSGTVPLTTLAGGLCQTAYIIITPIHPTGHC